MNDSAAGKRPLGTRWCVAGSVLASLGIVLAVAGVAARQLGLLDTFASFAAFGIGLLLTLLAIVTLVIGLLLSKGSGGDVAAGRAWGSLAAAVAVLLVSASLRPDHESGPAIHDLTTDIDNPPDFVAVVPLRADAQNPPEYAGAETAAQQQAAFPDLDTLVLANDYDDVFAAAEAVANESGWEIVSADATTGRIEATDTTRWFRFKDDVVIRIAAGEGGTAVDMRSKSRVGRGDMGTNAHRIRTFLANLTAKVGA